MAVIMPRFVVVRDDVSAAITITTAMHRLLLTLTPDGDYALVSLGGGDDVGAGVGFMPARLWGHHEEEAVAGRVG